MTKTEMLVIRITEEQSRILAERTTQAGLGKKSEYVRSVLFRKKIVEEKINTDDQKVVRDA